MAEEQTAAPAASEGVAEGQTEGQAPEQPVQVEDRYPNSPKPEKTQEEPQAEEPQKESPEAKAEEEKASDDGKTEKGEPTPLEITLPEGMEAHQGQAEAYQTHMGGWLKDNPEATAADALKEAARWQAETVQNAQTEAQAAWDKQVETWESEARADEEIGGDKFEENLAVAKKALEAYGSPELKEILEDSGIGNHKAVISAFYKIGKGLTEASVEPSSGMVANYDPYAARYSSSRSN